MDRIRYYIDTEGNDDKAYLEAIQLAQELSNKDPEIKQAALLIHTSLSIGWFERLFEKEVVVQLFDGIAIDNRNPIFKFETKKNYNQKIISSEIIITCGLDEEDDLLKIEKSESTKFIIAIPWCRYKFQHWIDKWDPIELRSKNNPVKPRELSPIAKKAFQELTNDINIQTGITYPSDEEQAKIYLLTLYTYDAPLDGTTVKNYLVNNLNWNMDHARDMETLIKILNSKKQFTGPQRALIHYYLRWEKECLYKNSSGVDI